MSQLSNCKRESFVRTDSNHDLSRRESFLRAGTGLFGSKNRHSHIRRDQGGRGSVAAGKMTSNASKDREGRVLGRAHQIVDGRNQNPSEHYLLNGPSGRSNTSSRMVCYRSRPLLEKIDTVINQVQKADKTGK